MGRKRRGRGEGSIYQEADGRWVATVSRGLGANGKRRRDKVRGDTKAEVQGKLQELLRAGPVENAGGLTVAEYLPRWLDAARPDLAETTVERWEALVRLYLIPNLGRARLAKLEPIHVEQLYADLYKQGVPTFTRHAAGTLLTVALNRAVKLRLIRHNPALDVSKPKLGKRDMLILDERQVKRLLEQARPHQLYALFALAVGTGMRQGEILGLHWPDVDFERGTVQVRRSLALVGGRFRLKEPKTESSRRKIALPPFVVEALQERRVRQLARGMMDRPVFCTRSGNFIGRQNLTQQVFYRLLREAELPEVRFHDLRHTHASSLLSRGHSIRAVSARLGHSKVEMTLKIYAHCLPDDDHVLAQGLQAMYG
jgi:integrase